MISVRYTDGTKCDINSNKPRETIVSYCKIFHLNNYHKKSEFFSLVCNEKGNDGIINFQEISSCYYEMTVTSSKLCNIPAFSPLEPNRHTINCYPQEKALQKPRNLKKLEYERQLSLKTSGGAQFTVRILLSSYLILSKNFFFSS